MISSPSKNITPEDRIRVNIMAKKAIEIRIKQTLEHPLAKYAEWVIKTVCEKLGCRVEDVKGTHRHTPILEARYFAIQIIYENTHFGEYSVAFFGKNRALYHNIKKKFKGLLQYRKNAEVFENLKSRCSLSEYNRLNNS